MNPSETKPGSMVASVFAMAEAYRLRRAKREAASVPQLAEAVENIVGDLCRAEDGKFASCGGAKATFDPKKITRLLRVVDTREVTEDEDGKSKRLAGSGVERECDRCGATHEIHVFVGTADGDEFCVGSSCAKGTSIERDVSSRVRSIGNLREKERAVVKLEAKVAEERRYVETLERMRNEARAFMPQPVLLGYVHSRARYGAPIRKTLAEIQADAVQYATEDKGVFDSIYARPVFGMKSYPGVTFQGSRYAKDSIEVPHRVEEGENYVPLTRVMRLKDEDRTNLAVPLDRDDADAVSYLTDALRRNMTYDWIRDAVEVRAKEAGVDFEKMDLGAKALPFTIESLEKAKILAMKTRMKADGSDDDAIETAVQSAKAALRAAARAEARRTGY